jgi:AcrR family transcriptional regulator
MNKRSGIETRKRIVDAAMEIFSAKGYAAANMREIAQSAGTSVGGMYLYFKNKEELYQSLIREKRNSLNSMIEMSTAQARTAKEALSAFVKLNFDHVVKHKEFILLHIREHGFAFSLEEKKQFFRQQINHLEKIIKKGTLSGEFRECNARDMAKIIGGSLRGIIISIALDEGPSVSPGMLSKFFLNNLLKEEISGQYHNEK